MCIRRLPVCIYRYTSVCQLLTHLFHSSSVTYFKEGEIVERSYFETRVGEKRWSC